jgi:A/G-specific adenine glycosylase
LAFAQDLVDQLPERKPRKVLPQRSCTMLVAIDDGHALLERRPPAGVWAGLWSLPQFETEQDASDFIRRSDLSRDDCRASQQIEHAFSHYRLSISTLSARRSSAAMRVADSDQQRWMRLDQLENIGLPAPVRTLLENLALETPKTSPAHTSTEENNQ